MGMMKEAQPCIIQTQKLVIAHIYCIVLAEMVLLALNRSLYIAVSFLLSFSHTPIPATLLLPFYPSSIGRGGKANSALEYYRGV